MMSKADASSTLLTRRLGMAIGDEFVNDRLPRTHVTSSAFLNTPDYLVEVHDPELAVLDSHHDGRAFFQAKLVANVSRDHQPSASSYPGLPLAPGLP